MKPIDVKRAQLLLTHFNASALGEGDINAGANALAGMALSLCNLLPPDDVVITADGSRVLLGSSFLVTGALSSALIIDRIISPLQCIQNNILGHVDQVEEVEAHRNEINTSAGLNILPGPGGPMYAANPIIEQIHGSELAFSKGALLNRLMAPPVGRTLSPIRETSILFATAAKPETVEEVLKTAHMGRPFVHMALREKADGKKFERVAWKVIDGTTLDSPVMRSVKGTWVITDPEQMMCRASQAKDQEAGWLSRMLWLSDLKDGPVFVKEGAKAVPPNFNAIRAYEETVMHVLRRRLNEEEDPELVQPITLSFPGNQSEWIGFLQGVESSLPGVTAPLRALPGSLYFGLVYLGDIKKKDAQVLAKWVLAFSRVLVARMIHAHQRISKDRKEARLAGITYKLQERLTTFPQKERDLYRAIGIPVSDCRRGLEVLADSGIATRDGDRWLLEPN